MADRPFILNTRSGPRAEATTALFADAGFQVLETPTRLYRPLLSPAELQSALQDHPKHALVLLSPTAARLTLRLAGPELLQLRQILALATATAEPLLEAGVTPSFVGLAGNAEDFAAEVLKYFDASSSDLPPMLLLQSRLGRDDFQVAISAVSGELKAIDLYDNEPNPAGMAVFEEAIEAHPSAMVLAYAPSALDGFSAATLARVRVASIGPRTTQALASLQMMIFCEADEPTNRSLLAALLKALEDASANAPKDE